VDGKKYPKLWMILPAWSVQKAASRRNLRSRRRADAEGETGIRGFMNGKDTRVVSNCDSVLELDAIRQLQRLPKSVPLHGVAKKVQSGTKGSNEAGHHTVVTVQALKVVLEPNLCKQAFAAKGNATPVTLLAAHMIPRARPFFWMNHWSINRDDGLNMSALPMAHIIP
jgi:hypothetical protein